jgi:hypothetical protein
VLAGRDLLMDRFRFLLLFQQVGVGRGLVVQVESQYGINIAQIQRGPCLHDLFGACPLLKRRYDKIQVDTGLADPDQALGIRTERDWLIGKNQCPGFSPFI